jgi:hypothetical protein
MVETLEAITLLEQGAYDTISGSSDFAAVGDTLSTLREADDTVLKTVISNGGDNAIEVYEDGVLVCIVPPNDSKELPLASKGQIKVKCADTLDSLVAIATFTQTIVS